MLDLLPPLKRTIKRRTFNSFLSSHLASNPIHQMASSDPNQLAGVVVRCLCAPAPTWRPTNYLHTDLPRDMVELSIIIWHVSCQSISFEPAPTWSGLSSTCSNLFLVGIMGSRGLFHKRPTLWGNALCAYYFMKKTPCI